MDENKGEIKVRKEAVLIRVPKETKLIGACVYIWMLYICIYMGERYLLQRNGLQLYSLASLKYVE